MRLTKLKMHQALLLLFTLSFLQSINNAQISFSNSGQNIGNSRSWSISLSDVENDGDLDALVSNWDFSDNQECILWLNNSNGSFIKSSQIFPAGQSRMELGDFNNDSYIDIWFGGIQWVSDTDGSVWLNDGHGNFSIGSRNYMSGSAALGDLDNDGDIDVVVTNWKIGIKIYLNDGNGLFTEHQQNLNQNATQNVCLGDLDGDGDLDAYIVSSAISENLNGLPDQVWMNDGSGNFINSGQSLGNYNGIKAVMGDVDNDSDLDVLVANGHVAPSPTEPAQPNILYLNDGNGNLIDSNQEMDIFPTSSAAFGDLDNDGDLDVVIFNGTAISSTGIANSVKINDGSGKFVDSGLSLGDFDSIDGAVGDLNGDGKLDIFEVNNGVAGQPNILWLNTSLTSVEEDDSSNQSPTNDFKLFQNFPNPFNPNTKIKYHIPEESFVTLKVYDVLGNEITTLASGEKLAGSYENEFNAIGLPSGLYFYQLKADSYSFIKKMLLLK
jgi:hypothetical protein